MKIIISVLLFVFISINVFGYDLTEEQIQNIKIAYEIGNEIVWRGETYGETVAAILFQESHAGSEKFKTRGVILGDLNSRGKYKSLGLMQIQVPALRDVLRWYPEILKKYFNYIPSNETLLLELLFNDKFNIEVGALYFAKMLELKGSWTKAILAYNIGVNGKVDINNYVNSVKKYRIDIILPLLRENKL